MPQKYIVPISVVLCKQLHEEKAPEDRVEYASNDKAKRAALREEKLYAVLYLTRMKSEDKIWR